ncbi:MAG TPA: hypothetical protein VG895_01295 [Patescibacteria group bacterium]|nr:hypothetical protein [Patescibacteria group bacterium]
MTKYQEYFNNMIANNKELFDEFKQIHDRYGLEEEKLQKEFNEIGAKVQTVIRQWEDKLCGRSEGSGYASYSGGLAQKFQDEVRKMFPLIDNVGIIRQAPALVEEPVFNLKKINL